VGRRDLSPAASAETPTAPLATQVDDAVAGLREEIGGSIEPIRGISRSSRIRSPAIEEFHPISTSSATPGDRNPSGGLRIRRYELETGHRARGRA
jgi:hypothetical protein